MQLQKCTDSARNTVLRLRVAGHSMKKRFMVSHETLWTWKRLELKREATDPQPQTLPLSALKHSFFFPFCIARVRNSKDAFCSPQFFPAGSESSAISPLVGIFNRTEFFWQLSCKTEKFRACCIWNDVNQWKHTVQMKEFPTLENISNNHPKIHPPETKMYLILEMLLLSKESFLGNSLRFQGNS